MVEYLNEMFCVWQAVCHVRRSFLNPISALRGTINTTEVPELSIKLQRLVDFIGNKIMIHVKANEEKQTRSVYKIVV